MRRFFFMWRVPCPPVLAIFRGLACYLEACYVFHVERLGEAMYVFMCGIWEGHVCCGSSAAFPCVIFSGTGMLSQVGRSLMKPVMYVFMCGGHVVKLTLC